MAIEQKRTLDYRPPPWPEDFSVRLGRLEDLSGTSLEEFARAAGLPMGRAKEWRCGAVPTVDELTVLVTDGKDAVGNADTEVDDTVSVTITVANLPLRPLPNILVHQRGKGDVDPVVPWSLVDPPTGFRRDLPGPAETSDTFVSRVRQNSVYNPLAPLFAMLCRGDPFVEEPPADRSDAQPFVDVHLKNPPHHLGLVLHHFRLAAVSDAVTVGDSSGWDPALLGGPALAQRSSLPEVVQFDLAYGRHETEGLYIDGVHHSLEPYLVGLDDFHQGCRRVHPPAQAVGLPADDGVETPGFGVSQHALELRTLLGPSLADLLVAGDYL